MIAALLTALVIAGFAYASGGLMYNPGPLNAEQGQMLGGVRSHAATGGQCEACHTAPWESAKMADRCAVCHTDIAAQMRDVAALHGLIAHKNSKATCRHCHPEHRGASAPLTALKGGEFPHEAVGFSLNGHQRTAGNEPFTCDDCHQGDVRTFALDSCQACHRQMDTVFTQAHVISFGTACLDCHDGVDRFGRNFNHSIFSFKLTGKHMDVACVKCHIDARGYSDFQVTLQDCYSCHQNNDPHEGRFGLDCAACHTADGWAPAKFDHNLAAFKLEGAHANVACEKCHVNNVYKGTPSDCYSCHKQDDEHNGRFGTDCSACHNPSDWRDASFDHDRSNFPLTGAHVDLACERCHSNGQFQGLNTACVACHENPGFHRGAFGTNCAECHNTFNWFDAQYFGPHPTFGEHGGINHEGATCRDCHPSTVFAYLPCVS